MCIYIDLYRQTHTLNDRHADKCIYRPSTNEYTDQVSNEYTDQLSNEYTDQVSNEYTE